MMFEQQLGLGHSWHRYGINLQNQQWKSAIAILISDPFLHDVYLLVFMSKW